MRRISKIVPVIAFSIVTLVVPSGRAIAGGTLHCDMKFSMKGWSAFYKTSEGEGTIHCDDGRNVPVSVKLVGGGITFGKTETKDGIGKFTAVEKFEDLLGSYGAAQAEAAAVKGAEAQALTNGTVSLALSGTGSGWSLGVSGAKFTITPKGAPKEAAKEAAKEAPKEAPASK